jgi:hypothetical protein
LMAPRGARPDQRAARWTELRAGPLLLAAPEKAAHVLAESFELISLTR